MTNMLPGLPRHADDRDRMVVASPRREVVEIRNDDQRVLHILEPVSTGLPAHQLRDHTDVAATLPSQGQVLVWNSETGKYTPAAVAAADHAGGLRAFVVTAPITVEVPNAGIVGDWTPAPVEWRTSCPAVAGEVLQWSPVVTLGGGPAALDLVSLIGGAPARYLSTGTSMPSALGSMYRQGDVGSISLPVQHWVVSPGDIVSGAVTLCLAYRLDDDPDSDTMTLAHGDAPSRITLANLGTPEV